MCFCYFPFNYDSITVKYTQDYNLAIEKNLGQLDWIEAKLLRPGEAISVEESVIFNGAKMNPLTETDSYGNLWSVYKFENIRAGNIALKREYTLSGSNEKDFIDKNYLDSNYVVLNKDINELAEELYSVDDLEFLINVSSWIKKNLSYDYSKLVDLYYNVNNSVQTFNSKKGVCVDYSILASAILKAEGIKSRFVAGIVYDGESWGSHAWLEAYLTGYGWVSIDPTYNQVYVLDLTHIKIGTFSDYSEMHDSISANFSLENVEIKKGNALNLDVAIISENKKEKTYVLDYPQKIYSGTDFNFCIDSNELILPIEFYNSLEPKEFVGVLYKNKCLEIQVPDYNGPVYAPFVLQLPGQKIEGSFYIEPQDQDKNSFLVQEKTEPETNKEDSTISISLVVLLGLVVVFALLLAKRYFFKPSL